MKTVKMIFDHNVQQMTEAEQAELERRIREVREEWDGRSVCGKPGASGFPCNKPTNHDGACEHDYYGPDYWDRLRELTALSQDMGLYE